MQILHEAEVAGGLPSDAKPIKTVLEAMSPPTMELPFWDLRCFPDEAEVQENLEWEKRWRVFPIWEERQVCVSADLNFKLIMSFAIYSNDFKNCRMQHYLFEIGKKKRKDLRISMT